jgi:hypothetical protein
MSDGSFRVPVQGLPAVTRPRVSAKPLFPASRLRVPVPANVTLVELSEASPRRHRAVGEVPSLGKPTPMDNGQGNMTPLNVVQFSPSYRCLQSTAPPVRVRTTVSCDARHVRLLAFNVVTRDP